MYSTLCKSVHLPRRCSIPAASTGAASTARPARLPRHMPGKWLLPAPSWSSTCQLQQSVCCAYCQAREQPEHTAANAIKKLVTNMIKNCDRLQEVSDVVNEWGSSFDHILTAAAFVKAAKLANKRQAASTQKGLLASLLPTLSTIWVSVQPGAGAGPLASVLWASSKLGCHDAKLWSATLKAFTSQAKSANCQELCNVAYAVAVAASANGDRVPGCATEEVQQAMRAIADSVIQQHNTAASD